MLTVYVGAAARTFHHGTAHHLPRAVLVRDGRVEGFADPDRRDTRADWGGARVHDLGGAVLAPGFFDAHNHQPSAARDRGQVRTAHVTGLDGLRAALAAAARERRPGEWISTEHPLTLSQLDPPELPTAADLDPVTPHHPTAVRFGAHTMVLNTRALRLSGLAALPADPPGGVLDRDPHTGAPLGPVREYGALRYVLAHLTGPDDLPAALRATQHEYARAGITALRVTGFRPGDRELYEALLAADGRLAHRVAGGPRLDPTTPLAERLAAVDAWDPAGPHSEWLRPDAVKIFVDGGVETALDGTTHLFTGPGDLLTLVRHAVARGWSVACHAVTADAVGLALDAYESVGGPAPGRRFAVEHGFLATPAQLARAARLGVWLSAQPAVAHIESALVHARLPDPTGAFPLASALAGGVRCALGSDWNATPGTRLRPFDPLASVRAAVTRAGADGRSLGADEAVDTATALYLHTRAPALLAGLDDVGGLWPGARADLVALGADPVEDLGAARVVGVVTGGEPLPDTPGERSAPPLHAPPHAP
ncbi:amidohydrolase [Streptomyces sp. NPDC050560]|uniref:amidohydrolase n=1 Tax=Streptomyces sp. NPDC050560 TaxID=3365630 RepID=UPI0037951446